jgi:hypothetical protein
LGAVRLWSLRMPALLAALIVIGAPALPASAQTPFTGLGATGGAGGTTTTATSTATTAPAVTIPTTSTSSGLSTLDYALIAAAVVILFATLTYLIRRDARTHAPRHAMRDIYRGRGTVTPQTERVKRARARAKRARRARRPRRN